MNNTPEHASAAVLVCSRVFLQGVGRRFQLVNQVRIKDVEFVTLHDLSYAAKFMSQLLPATLANPENLSTTGITSNRHMCLRLAQSVLVLTKFSHNIARTQFV